MLPRQRFATLRPIASQLPLYYTPERAMSSLTPRCMNCKKALDDDGFRGELLSHRGGWRVRAVVVCGGCQMCGYYSASLAYNKRLDVLELTEPAVYPIRVPWPEDQEEWDAIMEIMDEKHGAPVLPGQWVEIADRMIAMHAERLGKTA